MRRPARNPGAARNRRREKPPIRMPKIQHTRRFHLRDEFRSYPRVPSNALGQYAIGPLSSLLVAAARAWNFPARVEFPARVDSRARGKKEGSPHWSSSSHRITLKRLSINRVEQPQFSANNHGHGRCLWCCCSCAGGDRPHPLRRGDCPPAAAA